jgi:hypothetical protein
MTGLATAVDHVGVAVPNLDDAAAEWQALGFTVQPTAPHMADGKPTGTGNRTIMLAQGYIELLATIDPAKPSATIARFLAHHTGIHVLTLATDDAPTAQTRLTQAGFTAAITHSTRPAPPAPGMAAFARIPLTDAAPRLQLLQHLTPELVWQPAFLAHSNQAATLADVILAADPPAQVAARLARAAGRPLAPDPAGGLALPLPQGRIRILPPPTAAALLSSTTSAGTALPTPPCIPAIAIRTADANAAIARRLGQPQGAPLLAQASGVTVLFLP